MSRRSLRSPVVVEKHEAGCTWRLYKVINFREGLSKRNLLSNRRRSNANAIAAGNGNTRSMLDMAARIDDKHTEIDVHSKRRRLYGCKNIGSVKHDQVVRKHFSQDQRNDFTEAIASPKFVEANYSGRDEADTQSKQFLDALQILCSNKEFFLKILQDPNSLLVKRIHDFQDTQPRKQRQERKKVIRSAVESTVADHPTSYFANRKEPLKSSSIYSSTASCDPQSSDEILVLKPRQHQIKNSADRIFPCSSQNSSSISAYNGHTLSPSQLSFGHIKRKLTHAMEVRRKEQQWMPIDGVLNNIPCGCQGSECAGEVQGMENLGKNSLSNFQFDIKQGGAALHMNKRETTSKRNHLELSHSHHRNIEATSSGAPKQNDLDIHVGTRKDLSQMLKYDNKYSKPWTNTEVNSMSFLDNKYSPRSLERYMEYVFLAEKLGYSPCSHHHIMHEKMKELHIENGKGGFSSSKHNVSPSVHVENQNPKMQVFGANINYITKSLSTNSSHVDYGNPGGCMSIVESKDAIRLGLPSETSSGFKNSPTQRSGMDNKIEKITSLLVDHGDSPLEAPLSTVPHISSSILPNIQRMEESDSLKVSGKRFVKGYLSSPACTISDHAETELPVQPPHNTVEDHNFSNSDQLKSPLGPINTVKYVTTLLQASHLNWEELFVKCPSLDQLLDLPLLNEIKTLTNQTCGNSRILFDCLNDAILEVYHRHFRCSPWISSIKPDFKTPPGKRSVVHEVKNCIDLYFLQQPSSRTLEHLVQNDLARSGLWPDIQFDVEDIAIEMEEDVLQDLIMESLFEMDA